MSLSHASTRKYLRHVTHMSLIMGLYISYIQMSLMNNICINQNEESSL